MNRYRRSTLVLEVGLIVVALIHLLPILGLINVALKDRRNYSGAFEITGRYTLDNFVQAWNEARLGPALFNSAFIAIVSIVAILVIGAMAAYPLSRIGRTWSRVVFYAFLAGLVIPGQLALLPFFRDMRDLGLVGGVVPVLLINIAGAMPFTIFVLTTFLREMSRDYEEASLLDGCGPIRSFVFIVVPLMRPALATVAILNGIALWNNFFIALLYLSGSGMETAPVRINRFVGEFSSNWPVIFAALCITTVPILAVYFALQRSIIQGFAGGLKG